MTREGAYSSIGVSKTDNGKVINKISDNKIIIKMLENISSSENIHAEQLEPTI